MLEDLLRVKVAGMSASSYLSRVISPNYFCLPILIIPFH